MKATFTKNPSLTSRNASKLLKQEMNRRGIGYKRLAARNVEFSDIVFGSRRHKVVGKGVYGIFVRVLGYNANNPRADILWDELRQYAAKHGFYIELEPWGKP